jgi:deoxyribodipyrimidine photolyase
MPSRAVVWFRRDLRVADHPALLAALDAADQVVPTFVVDRTLLEGRPSGPNRRAFLHGRSRRWPATWRPSAGACWSARATPSL